MPFLTPSDGRDQATRPRRDKPVLFFINAIGTYLCCAALSLLVAYAHHRWLPYQIDNSWLRGSLYPLVVCGMLVAAAYYLGRSEDRWPVGVWAGARAYMVVTVVLGVLIALI